MKKAFILFVFLYIFSFTVYSQQHTGRYLELPASFDATGNNIMGNIPENVKHGADTTIDNKAINQLISKGRTVQKLINLLAAEGWQLLWVVNTGKTEGMLASVPQPAVLF